MENEQRSSAGALLSGLRRQETKPCVVCGAEFTALRLGLYCGNTCKIKAYRKRKKDKGNRAMQVADPAQRG